MNVPKIPPIPTIFKTKIVWEFFMAIRNSLNDRNVLPSYTTAELTAMTPTVIGFTAWNTTTDQVYIWTGSTWRVI